MNRNIIDVYLLLIEEIQRVLNCKICHIIKQILRMKIEREKKIKYIQWYLIQESSLRSSLLLMMRKYIHERLQCSTFRFSDSLNGYQIPFSYHFNYHFIIVDKTRVVKYSLNFLYLCTNNTVLRSKH